MTKLSPKSTSIPGSLFPPSRGWEEEGPWKLGWPKILILNHNITIYQSTKTTDRINNLNRPIRMLIGSPMKTESSICCSSSIRKLPIVLTKLAWDCVGKITNISHWSFCTDLTVHDLNYQVSQYGSRAWLICVKSL